uniref:DUF726-domain-containing protein n=1 Tax=Theileria annulata TaxID=5874 RepID=A0A3B0MUW1_THEAN
MIGRLHRQNSFGPPEKKSTLVISRAMEFKILEGESSIPNASPVVLESINKSLESLIVSHRGTKRVVCDLPSFVNNIVISHCDLSDKELIDKRYGEYFDGYSLANNVQYIPVEIECLANLGPELSKSILSLFVSIIFDYISEDNNLLEPELIKWGTTFLQRMGKILNLTEVDVSSIIKPVSQSLELKQLGMNFDDLKLEKRIHVNYIQEQLRPMQDSINDFFKQAIGTDDNESDFTTEVSQTEMNKQSEPPDLLNDETDQDFLKYFPDDKYLSQYIQDKQQLVQDSQEQNLLKVESDEDLLQDDLEADDEDKEEEECFKRNFIENYRPDGEPDDENDPFSEVLGTLEPPLSQEITETINLEHFNFNTDPNVNMNDNTDLNADDVNKSDLNVDDVNESSKLIDMNINSSPSNLSSSSSSETVLDADEQEQESDNLLRDLERSIGHKSGPSNVDYENLLNDMSNLNLPPKKNKSLPSKILGNISKKINRVFSINSDKTGKVSYKSSIESHRSYPNQDYLNNLLLIEKSPDVVAVLVRNLLLKYIISGFNDSRAQVVFAKFANLLGVTTASVLSIENNIVSDLAGILDVNAAKTSSKKVSKRLKILSATVGGTALLALTAGVASPVLAVGIAFLGLSGTGFSTYLSSNEGYNVLKNIFGLNVSLTQFKARREQMTNLQFIQMNPNVFGDTMSDAESSHYSSGKESNRPEKEEVNSNYIGICICVGNNVFLNEIFFFENESFDFKSTETIRHLDSEYIEIWKRQFPVPINDLYLLKWESKLLASLHRMLLKLTSLSIYQKSLELYRTINNSVYVTNVNPKDLLDSNSLFDTGGMVQADNVRDSSGGNRYFSIEGSSGNYYSSPNRNSPTISPTKDRDSGSSKFDPYNNNNINNINWPLALIQLCSNLDNCWLVCRSRAEVCGGLLATAICDKLLTGDRHVSLIGYSMGARAILYCLLKLFERNKLNTVKDVVLMGLPSTAGYSEWSKCSSVVAGRLINVYNENDWILAFLYRYTSINKVAGLAPVVHEKVENFNVCNLFDSHADYFENISKILSFINIQL